MAIKLGSLFDGSGGFPLAGIINGIEPAWASEIEPYPLRVTEARFPNMKHLGSVTDIDGASVEPVDVITFGSPCQDLSIAGKQKGIHDGDRSNLFFEAVRIIKEMRSKDEANGWTDVDVRPRFAVWENVPGAFSSNKGRDFQAVLQALAEVKDATVSVPGPEGGKWKPAGCIVGDGWSIAWRVYDAQFWGVPQRRKRIYLVADFASERAGEILFECESLRGDSSQSGEAWEGTASSSEGSTASDDREGVGIDLYNLAVSGDKAVTLTANSGVSATHAGPAVCVPYTLKIRSGCEGGGKGALIQTDKSATLATNNDQYLFQPIAYSFDSLASNSMKSNNPHSGCRAVDTAKTLDTTDPNPCKNQGGIAVVEQYLFENHSQDARYRGPLDVSPMLPAQLGTGGNNQPLVACLASGKETVGTLMANAGTKLWLGNQEAFSGDYSIIENRGVYYIVRRLTPTECARLQGFPDEWGHVTQKDELTDEEYNFWLTARNTHAAINGKAQKEYTREQMLNWYNKLHTDSAEYKMWGNGIALPCAIDVLNRIARAISNV